MSKIVIIIPSRLNAKRLPNKPLKIINKKEMIEVNQDNLTLLIDSEVGKAIEKITQNANRK